MNVGIIGFGYWGPNLARNVARNTDLRLTHISDTQMDRLREAHLLYPHAKLTAEATEIFSDPEVHAVVITTPVSTHFPLALAALKSGKHVLIAKPLTLKYIESEALVTMAKNLNRILMVDHTFLFAGAVRQLKETIDNGEIGKLYYYDSVRINLGLIQSDVNVIWDLAPHDFSLVQYLVGQLPHSVCAQGQAHIKPGLVDMAYVTSFYPDNFIAHFHFNWLSPVKIRRTIIGGSNKMVVWDDLDPDHKLKVYNKGVDFDSKENEHIRRTTYRIGDMYSPVSDSSEALGLEIAHFADCIKNGQPSISDGNFGAQVVRVLEKVQWSLENNGAIVEC